MIKEYISTPPIGTFATRNPSGFIYPIFIHTKCILAERVAVHNNPEGEKIAMEIESGEEFVKWAINPWSSVININEEESRQMKQQMMEFFGI